MADADPNNFKVHLEKFVRGSKGAVRKLNAMADRVDAIGDTVDGLSGKVKKLQSSVGLASFLVVNLQGTLVTFTGSGKLTSSGTSNAIDPGDL